MTVDLESLTAGLFSACDTRLGDTLTITPPSAAAISAKADINYGDALNDFGDSSSVAQSIEIDIDASLLPSKPGIGWRVTLPRIAGKIFEPRNVRRDASGRRWLFGLKDTHA